MAKKPDRLPPANRTAIIVLGMHRSGTSALARIVNFLGAAVPRHLVPANQTNPRGHWESASLVDLHDQLLSALDSSWDDWRTPGPRWKESDAAGRFSGRIRLSIDEEYGNAPLFVLKDPRICRTLPYWMSILEKSGIRSAPLIVVRNPLEVAESLRVRDGISFEKAMLLWLRHNLEVEYETRHLQRNIVTFDALLEDWKLLAVQSGSRLGIAWPRQPTDAASDVREFLDIELHNHRATQAELESHTEVPQWVKAAYRALILLCDEPKSAEPKRELDKVRHAFAESAKIFGGVAFAQTDALKKAALDVGNAQGRVRDLEGELDAAVTRANEFETALTQIRSEAKDSTAAAEDLRKRSQAADKRIAALTKEVEALRQVTADATELKALAKRVTDRTEWIEGQLLSQQTKSEKTKGELEEMRSKALSMSAALHNAVALQKELAAAKDQTHAHETRALKAEAAARQYQESLAGARNRLAELEADERNAQAEITELRAELADAWGRASDVPHRSPTKHTEPMPSEVSHLTLVGAPELKRAAHDAEIRAQRIADDLRYERMHVQKLERRLSTWMGLASAALRKITRLGGRPARAAPPKQPKRIAASHT